MAFDAGAIEATLTLDRTPFRRDLRRADQEARRAERRRYRLRIDLEDDVAQRRLSGLERRLVALSSSAVRIRMDASSQDALKTVARLRRQMRQASTTQTVRVDANTTAAQAATTALRRNLAALGRERVRPRVDTRDIKRAREDVQDTTKSMTLLGRMRARPRVNLRGTAAATAQLVMLGGLLQTLNRANKIPILVTGVTAAVAGLMQVGSALMAVIRTAAQATGVLVALPAVIAAAAAGMAVLTVAFSGFGDALKKDMEVALPALEQLPPRARAAAYALRSLREPLDEIKTGIQQAFFSGLAPMLERLGTGLLPTLGIGLTNTAGGLNLMAREVLSFANSQKFLSDLSFILLNVADGWKALAPAAKPFLNALSDITAVGSTYLPAMGETITGLAERFERFISHARETGKLAAWIEGGVQAFKDLYSIAQLTGEIFSGLFRGLRGGGDPMGIGEVKESLQGISDFINSSGVQSTLIEFTDMFRANLELISDAFKTYILPAIESIRPAIENFISGSGKYFLGWIATVTETIRFLAPVINALAAAFNYLAPVLGIIGGAISLIVTGMLIYRGVMTVVRAVTLAWSVAVWALNSALLANPIVWIVIAIAALIAIVVLCYKRFEGFRNVVNAVWEAIKTGALFVWNKVLVPFFNWINGIIHNHVGPAFMWLWENAIKPAWDAIVTGALWLWNKVLQPIFKAMGWVIMNVIIPYYQFLWSVMKVVWAGIWKVIQIAWGIIKIIFAAVVWYVKNILAPPFLWIWKTIIKPAFDGIAIAIKWAWEKIIKPSWEAMKIGLAVLAAVFNREKARIQAIWNLLKALIKAGWDYVNAKVFDPFKKGIGALADAFDEGRKNIKTAWNKIKDAAKAPVKFMVETVYMGGIKPMWDKVADLVDADPLPSISLPAGFAKGGVFDRVKGFARGGRLAGYSTWQGGDTHLVPMRRGEGVQVSETMRDRYERYRLSVMNKFGVQGKSARQARQFLGESVRKVGSQAIPSLRSGTGSPGFARGGWMGVGSVSPPKDGIFDAVKEFVKEIASAAFSGDIEGLVKTIFSPAKSALGMFGKEGIPGIPYMMLGNVEKKITDYVTEMAGALFATGDGMPQITGLRGLPGNVVRIAQASVGKYPESGGNNRNAITSWFGMNGQPWCAMFISWLFAQAKASGSLGRASRTAWTGDYYNSGMKRVGTRLPGDVLVYGTRHVNLSLGGRRTIGGNESNNVRYSSNYPGSPAIFRPHWNHVGGLARGGLVTKQLLGRIARQDPNDRTTSVQRALRAYDQGGVLRPGVTMAFNGTGRNETIFTPEQLEELARAGFGGGITITVQAAPGESTEQVVDRTLFQVRAANQGGVFSNRRRKLT